MTEFGSFKPEHEEILHSMLGSNSLAKAGKMFGFPGYKVNGKLAAGLYNNGIVVKLGAPRAKALIGKQPGITTFEPIEGRVWKDWVLLTDHFEQHTALFEEAVHYVAENG
jgi:hypothetical protein